MIQTLVRVKGLLTSVFSLSLSTHCSCVNQETAVWTNKLFATRSIYPSLAVSFYLIASQMATYSWYSELLLTRALKRMWCHLRHSPLSTESGDILLYYKWHHHTQKPDRWAKEVPSHVPVTIERCSTLLGTLCLTTHHQYTSHFKFHSKCF